jgi:hypothetical protein
MVATACVPGARVGRAGGTEEGRAHHACYSLRIAYAPLHDPRTTQNWRMAGRSRNRRTSAGWRGGGHGTARGQISRAAAVPQGFDKRYFTLQIMAPYSEARDAHLYTRLLFPVDANRLFLSEFTDLITRFTEYLN